MPHSGDLKQQNPSAGKKSRESERRRRRRKQKKIRKVPQRTDGTTANGDDSDADVVEGDSSKENIDHIKSTEQVEVEYVPEKAEFDVELDEDFRKVFKKFSFKENIGTEENDKKDVASVNASNTKVADSDSEEEEHDTQQKKKGGMSNKKKKLQRRMNIAELKQISSRPDVVEVWDATSADPKLLVYLKSYRNTVPVPGIGVRKGNSYRGAAVTTMKSWTWKTWYRETTFPTP